MEGGARVAALGGAATALSGDVWGVGNPASWGTLPGRALAFFATEAFGLSELRLGAAQYVETTKLGAFAAGAKTYGFDDYREMQYVLGYANGFGLGTARRLYLGVSARYHAISIPNYGNAGTMGLSIGGLVSVLPMLNLGFQATNFHAPKLGDREELPRTLSLGLSYLPVEQLLVAFDVFKDVRFPMSLRTGIEAHPVSALFLRAGATTNPTRFSAGIGLRLGLIAADVAGEYHEVLGWSPAISFGLQWR